MTAKKELTVISARFGLFGKAKDAPISSHAVLAPIQLVAEFMILKQSLAPSYDQPGSQLFDPITTHI